MQPGIKQVNTYSGVVLEKEIYRGGWRGILSGMPRPPLKRFANEEERKKHKEKMLRKHHTQMVNANFSPGDLLLCLSFNAQNEVMYFEDARRIRDNFVRRLRYKYPDAVIFIYMGRGSGSRIHFHALIKGIPLEYVLYQWPYGGYKEKEENIDLTDPGEIKAQYGVDVKYLSENRIINGVDHGPNYEQTANYLFKHWTEEQGGHRWKMTRNAKQPEREEDTSEPEEALARYSEQNPPPAPRGYKLVESYSTAFGYLYFKYVKELPKRQKNGKKITL